ncbi:MAG: hypothetical protein PHE36_09290 [Novosphingobium sp.]|nr:hypothetical protein [Novosphingobium sp.]
MPDLPTDLDFSTTEGRRATPVRMNRMSEHVAARLRALEANRQNWDAAVAQLKALGLERVTAVLQPLFDQAVADAAAISATRAAIEDPQWRAQLIEDVTDALIAAGTFVKAGTPGITLYSGTEAPPANTGAEGDIYIYVEPA